MSKRNQIIKETAESLALKELRNHSGLSVRKLAEQMKISHTRVYQMESGREDIPETHVKTFIKALDISEKDWDQVLKGQSPKVSLRDLCHDLVSNIDESKLELIYGLLSNF